MQGLLWKEASELHDAPLWLILYDKQLVCWELERTGLNTTHYMPVFSCCHAENGSVLCAVKQHMGNAVHHVMWQQTEIGNKTFLADFYL